MSEERILTLHPRGKNGVNILKRRYDQIKDTLISILEESGEMEFKQLNVQATNRLRDSFDGKLTWYVVTVKQDLEARGIIQQAQGRGSQRVRLIN